MNIKCPSCNKVLRIDETRFTEGKILIQCPNCSQRLSVPFPKQSRILEQESNPELPSENDLYKLKVLIDRKSSAEIVTHLGSIINSREAGVSVMANYSKLFKKDLIEDLKNLSNSYERIKTYVQKFIDWDLVEPKYPHERRNQRPENHANADNVSAFDWKAEALKPRKEGGMSAWKIILLIIALLIFLSRIMA